MRANFTVVEITDKYILIQDNCSNANPSMTITNDAEDVVEDLFEKNLIGPFSLIFYIDTDGRVDELLHEYRRFIGFRSGYDTLQDFYDSNIK